LISITLVETKLFIAFRPGVVVPVVLTAILSHCRVFAGHNILTINVPVKFKIEVETLMLQVAVPEQTFDSPLGHRTPGVVTPGVVTPGVVTPGVVTPGVVTPGVVGRGFRYPCLSVCGTQYGEASYNLA